MGADSLLIQQYRGFFLWQYTRIAPSETTPVPNSTMFFLPSTHIILHGEKKSKAGWIFVIVNKSPDKAKTNNVLVPASTLKDFPV